MVEKPVTVADEIIKEKESPCPLGEALDDMSEKLRGEFLSVLQGSPKTFPTEAIVRSLERRGYHLNRHRVQGCRKNCTCGRIKEIS